MKKDSEAIMKLLHSLAIFVLIFAAASAADTTCSDCKQANTQKVSYSVRITWKSYSKKESCDCTCYEELIEKLQQYFDGCDEATGKYVGDGSEKAACAMDSFQKLLTKLIYFANSNSTILSEGAISIMEALGHCNKLGGTSLEMLSEFDKVFLKISNEFEDLSLTLVNHIGDIARHFADTIHDFSCVFSKFMKKLLLSCKATGCQIKVSTEPTGRKLQELKSLLANIAEMVKKKCNSSVEEQKSVIILWLIVWYLEIVVNGKFSDMLDLLARNKRVVTQTTVALSLAFDYSLDAVTRSATAVVLPITQTVSDTLQTSITNGSSALNILTKDILGLVTGVTGNVGDITKNLFKGLELAPVGTDRPNVAMGLGST